MPATDAEILAALNANGGGYKKTARALGVPVERVRELGRNARSGAGARGLSESGGLVELSEVQRIEQLITETDDAMSAAVDREQHTDKYLAILRGLSKDLEAAKVKEKEAGRGAPPSDPDAILAQLPGMIAEAPEQLIEVIEEAIAARRQQVTPLRGGR